MIRTKLAALAATALAALSVALTATPAHANNEEVVFLGADNQVIARAWYTDYTDTLCVWAAFSGAYAGIGPEGDAMRYPIGTSGETRCTGNLSIPEDVWWRIRLEFRGAVKFKGFYT